MNKNAGTQAADSTWVSDCTKNWLAQFYGCTNAKQDALTMWNLCQFIRWFNKHNAIA
jgi:hypothetical protein